MSVGFAENRICPAGEVRMPVDCVGLNRSYVAFDFLKVVGGRLFFEDRHLNRFFRTMELMRIGIEQSKSDVLAILQELADGSEDEFYGLKLFAVPIDECARDDSLFRAQLYIIPVAIPLKSASFYELGSKLVTVEYQRFLPDVKSTNYLASMYWEPEVKKQGAIEPLFISQNRILETARSNIFLLHKGELLTNETGVLKGITRSIVLDLALKLNLPVSIRDISLEDLYAADEVFVTSTTKGVAPIVEVDDKKIGAGKVGPFTRRLVDGYQRLIVAERS